MQTKATIWVSKERDEVVEDLFESGEYKMFKKFE